MAYLGHAIVDGEAGESVFSIIDLGPPIEKRSQRLTIENQANSNLGSGPP